MKVWPVSVTCWKMIVCIVWAVSLSSVVDAQKLPSNLIRIQRLDTAEYPTPEYRVDRVRFEGSRSREWTQLSAQYSSQPQWIDEATVRYYALARGRGEGPKYTLLRGEVDYVNLEKGSHRSVMYVHPTTVRRYGDIQRLAVVILVKGQPAAWDSKPASKKRWWENFSPVDGLLLNRLETPFALINFDNFDAIEPRGRR